jgi:protoporphyrinogen oxidase
MHEHYAAEEVWHNNHINTLLISVFVQSCSKLSISCILLRILGLTDLLYSIEINLLVRSRNKKVLVVFPVLE